MACSFISGWGHKVHPNNPPAVAWSSESYWNLPPIFLAMLCWRSANGVASRDVAPDRLQTVLHLLAASDCEGGGWGRRRGREEEEEQQHPLLQFHFANFSTPFFNSHLISACQHNTVLIFIQNTTVGEKFFFFLKKRKCLYKDTDSIFFFKCLNVTEYK